tara:strand:- start:1061 stop:1213 length:153 start_codon:yes stop_codon:yes gene_type:complete
MNQSALPVISGKDDQFLIRRTRSRKAKPANPAVTARQIRLAELFFSGILQ